MAATDAAKRQPGSSHDSVRLQRRDSVGRARRVEPAHGRPQARQTLIATNRGDQRTGEHGRHRSGAGGACDRQLDVVDEVLEPRLVASVAPPQQIEAGWQVHLWRRQRRAQSTPDPVATDRAPVLTTDREGDPGRVAVLVGEMPYPDVPARGPPAVTEPLEVATLRDPVDHALRRWRPFWRRDLSTARPARVDMR